MDLMYTNAKRVDQGVLSAYALDLSFGAEENDFELTIGADSPALDYGAFIYMEGTEYGGINDAIKTSTNGDSVTYMGRTWHGILNSKVIEPSAGNDYLIVSGDANDVLSFLIKRLGLDSLFVAAEEPSGINISNYQFARYCKGYDGINAMLATVNAKLVVAWENRSVRLSVVPSVDYTDSPIDGDVATLKVEQHGQKVNHLICLGSGELAKRKVIHLYADRFGQIIDKPYYTGISEVVEIYENANSDNLRTDGEKRLSELLNTDKAEMSLTEKDVVFDIGDVVGANEARTGVSIDAKVTQKIVKINNGAIRIEYKTGG